LQNILVMQQWLWIAITLGLTAAGCASTSTKLSTARDVASGEAEGYLRRSDLKLHDYQGRLAHLRDELRRNRARSGNRHKRFRDLDDVEIKLNEARENLYELRVSNRNAWERFRARLDYVMDDVGQSFAKLNAE